MIGLRLSVFTQPRPVRVFPVMAAMLRVNDLSGFVARNLSGRHSAPQGVRHETNGGATGDTEDEIRGSV